MTKIYIIKSFNKGFYKIKRPDGIIHNMSEKKVDNLKQDKDNKFIEAEKEKVVVESNKKSLYRMKKEELLEEARKYGVNEELTRKEIIAHIEDKKKVPDVLNDGEERLKKLQELGEADLITIAKRLGLDSADKKMSKEQLIEYISEHNE